MRIGTWNLAGRWGDAHRRLIVDAACDLWLLTEVTEKTKLDGYHLHHTQELTPTGTYWAVIASSSPVTPEPDPHFATAVASVANVRVVCSVLPWRSCGPTWPGRTLFDKQTLALEAIRPALGLGPVIWGGDWNQAFEGPEYVGTVAGRERLSALLSQSRLALATALLDSAVLGHRSIDHVAIAATWSIKSATRIAAESGGRRLSDHDAYMVETDQPSIPD